MSLSIEVNTVLETAVVRLAGRLDAVDRFDGRIDEVLRTASLVILDLSNLHYVDADGIGQLIAAYQSVDRRDARLVLFRPNPRLLSLLRTTRLIGVFEIAGDTERSRFHEKASLGTPSVWRNAGSLLQSLTSCDR